MKTNIDPVWRRYEKQFLFFKIKNRKKKFNNEKI